MELRIIHVKIDYKHFGFDMINLLNEGQLKPLTDLSKEGWEIKSATPIVVESTTRAVCFTLQRQSENQLPPDELKK